jgi:hypothetical protein
MQNKQCAIYHSHIIHLRYVVTGHIIHCWPKHCSCHGTSQQMQAMWHSCCVLASNKIKTVVWGLEATKVCIICIVAIYLHVWEKAKFLVQIRTFIQELNHTIPWHNVLLEMWYEKYDPIDLWRQYYDMDVRSAIQGLTIKLNSSDNFIIQEPWNITHIALIWWSVIIIHFQQWRTDFKTITSGTEMWYYGWWNKTWTLSAGKRYEHPYDIVNFSVVVEIMCKTSGRVIKLT